MAQKWIAPSSDRKRERFWGSDNGGTASTFADSISLAELVATDVSIVAALLTKETLACRRAKLSAKLAARMTNDGRCGAQVLSKVRRWFRCSSGSGTKVPLKKSGA